MREVNISIKSVFRILGIPLAFYLVWINKDLVFAMFMALILMSALRPLVHYLVEKKNIPTSLASFLVVLCAFVGLAFLVGAILPPLFIETILFIEKLPDVLRSLNPMLSQYVGIQEISQFIPSFANQLVNIAGDIFSNTFLIFITLFMSYYLLANEKVIENQMVKRFVGIRVEEEKTKELLRVFHAAQSRLASWFWGELTLMFVVGVTSYIGFSWIGMKYALPLAVLAGILEALPNIGPIFAGLVAVLIGFGQAPIVGFAALAVSIVIQQLENYVLVPYIMKKAVGLNPLVTMLAVVLGLRLAGPLGALLAIPTYVLAESIYTETYLKEKNLGNNAEIVRKKDAPTQST